VITGLQGHFSSETPTRTGTFSVNCIQHCRSNDEWKRKDLGEISAVTVVQQRLGQLPTDCSMRILVICRAVTQKMVLAELQ